MTWFITREHRTMLNFYKHLFVNTNLLICTTSISIFMIIISILLIIKPKRKI